MSMRSAVLGAVVCEHVFYIQILSAVKRQHFIMKNGCRMSRYLAGVYIRKFILLVLFPFGDFFCDAMHSWLKDRPRPERRLDKPPSNCYFRKLSWLPRRRRAEFANLPALRKR